MADVRALLFPRSLAVVGASPRRAETIASVIRSGIPAWGVNPNRAEVEGLRCYPSIADLPETPETALLLVGHERVEQAFDGGGCGWVSARSSYPGSAARPAPTGARSSSASPPARRSSEPLCSARTAWASPVRPARRPGSGRFPRPSLPDTYRPSASPVRSARRCSASVGASGFRCIVSSGGEAVTDTADFLDFLADDPGTRAVGLFLETVRRPGAFAAALARCAAAGKPVVCLKVGRSQAAARAALAHTGALVGSDRAFSAAPSSPRRDRGRRLPRARRDARAARAPPLAARNATRRHLRVGRRVRAPRRPRRGGRDPVRTAAGRPRRGGSPRSSRTTSSPTNPLDAWAVEEADVVYPRSLELMAAVGGVRRPPRPDRPVPVSRRLGAVLVRIDRPRARRRHARHRDLPRGHLRAQRRPSPGNAGARPRARPRAPARLGRRDAGARERRALATGPPARPRRWARRLGPAPRRRSARRARLGARARALRRPVRAPPPGSLARRGSAGGRGARRAGGRQGRRIGAQEPRRAASSSAFRIPLPQRLPHGASAGPCSSRDSSKPVRRRSAG